MSAVQNLVRKIEEGEKCDKKSQVKDLMKKFEGGDNSSCSKPAQKPKVHWKESVTEHNEVEIEDQVTPPTSNLENLNINQGQPDENTENQGQPDQDIEDQGQQDTNIEEESQQVVNDDLSPEENENTEGQPTGQGEYLETDLDEFAD